jgi:hypothetical protein
MPSRSMPPFLGCAAGLAEVVAETGVDPAAAGATGRTVGDAAGWLVGLQLASTASPAPEAIIRRTFRLLTPELIRHPQMVFSPARRSV